MNINSIKIKQTVSYLVIMLMLMTSYKLSATHIVGADMTFTCLSNGYYEINLTVRRDCENGDPEADFDDPAFVGLFDTYGTPLDWIGSSGMLRMPLLSVTDIGSDIVTCDVEASKVCVTEARYSAKIYLPYRESGYILAYQRCCRNTTLSNILNPLESGSTSWVCIMPETMNTCNSSPKFTEWPDLYICADQELTFDASGTDADGDSLVYSLYTPYAGGSFSNPQPIPPSGPPYDEVEYAAGFSLENLLGGGDPLQIDPVSGVITARPTLVGQYLVGILIDEYRNGEIISKTRRNFEYNVRICGEGEAVSFEALEDVKCDGYDVTMTNTSENLDQDFIWNFNYPSSDPAFTSTEVSPTFTYIAPGTYTIRLVDAAGQACNGAYEQTITVLEPTLTPSFTSEITTCVAGQTNRTLTLTSTSVETAQGESISSTSFVVEYGGQVIARPNVEGGVLSIDVPCNQEIAAYVQVTSTSGCTVRTATTIVAAPDFGQGGSTVSFDGIPSTICPGESVRISENGDETWTYVWRPTETLDLTSPHDPIARPTVTTTYYVTVSNSGSSIMDSVTVTVLEDELQAEISEAIACSGVISLSGSASSTSDSDVLYEWSYDEDFSSVIASGATVDITPEDGTSRIYMRASAEGLCSDITFIDYSDIPGLSNGDGTGNGLYTFITYPINTCVGPNSEILLVRNDSSDFSVVWEASDNITSDLNTNQIDITSLAGQNEVIVTYTATTADGCAVTDMITVPIYDNLEVNIDIAGQGGRCGASSVFTADINANPAAVNYEWSTTADFTNIISTEQIYSNELSVGSTLYVRASTSLCVSNVASRVITEEDVIETISILNNGINTCLGNTGTVSVVNNDPTQTITVVWTASENISSGLNGETVNVQLLEGQTSFPVTYTVSTSSGCTYTETLTISSFEEFEVGIATGASVGNNCGGYVATSTVDLSLPGTMVEWSDTPDFTNILANGLSYVTDLPIGATLYIRSVSPTGCVSDVASIIVDEEGRNGQGSVSEQVTPINTCVGPTGSVTISATGADETVSITWAPSENITSADLNSPTIDVIAIDGQASVSVSYTGTISSGCAVSGTVVIPVTSDFSVDIDLIGDGGSGCEAGSGAYQGLSNLDLDLVTFEWSDQADFSNILSSDQTIDVDLPAGSTIYLRGTSPTGCVSAPISYEIPTGDTNDNISILNNGINTCLGNTGSISVLNNDLTQTITVVWSASENITSGLNGETVNVQLLEGQTSFPVTYTVTTSGGCTFTETITISSFEEFEVGIATGASAGNNCGGYVATSTVDLSLPGTMIEWSDTQDFTNILANGLSYVTNLPVGATLYIRAVSPTGCASEVASIIVDEEGRNGSGAVSEQITPINTCVGPTGSVSVSATGSDETVSIAWTPSENITSADLNSPTIDVIAIDGQTSVSISYTGTTSSGCALSRTVVIPVTSDFSVDIDLIGDGGSGCETSGSYQGLSNLDLDLVLFEWSDQADFSNILSSDQTIDVDLPAGSTLYLRGTSPTGCVSAPISYEIPAGDADFITAEYDDINTCVSTETPVTILNADPSMSFEVSWTASDNIVGELDSPNIMVRVIGDEEVIELTYSVVTSGGCTKQETIMINAARDLVVEIVPVTDGMGSGGTGSGSGDGSGGTGDGTGGSGSGDGSGAGDMSGTSCTKTNTFRAVANVANIEDVDLEWSLSPDFAEVYSTEEIVTVDLPEGGTLYLRGRAGDCVSDASTIIVQPSTSFEVIAPDRICAGDTANVELVLPSEYTLIWSAATGLVSAPEANPATITTTGGNGADIVLMYTATSPEGCVDTGTVEIPFSTVMPTEFDQSPVCGTASADLSIADIYTDGDVLWTFVVDSDTLTSTSANPNFDFGAAGVYSGVLTSTMQTCNFGDEMVNVVIPTVLEIDTEDDLTQAYCGGDSILTLTVTSSASTVVWVDQDGELLSTGESIMVDASSASQAIARVSDSFGCEDSIVFSIEQYEFDLTIDGPGAGSTICAGDSPNITVTDNTGGNISFMWMSASGAVLSGGDTANPEIDPALAGDLVLVATNDDLGCSTEIPYPLSAHSPIAVDITPDNPTINSGESIDLTAVTDAMGVTYMWTPDVGSTEVVNVSPEETTNYTVKITDENGCMATASETVIVNDPLCTTIFIPSAFTPNNDGNNDELIVRSDGPMEDFDFFIKDRWGNEVFRTQNPDLGWNGLHDNVGDNLAPGTFVYCVKTTCNGEMRVLHGSVALIR